MTTITAKNAELRVPPVEDALVTFPEGLPGFENIRQFLLVTGEQMGPFTLVQGMGVDAPSFLAIDPHQIDAAFRPSIAAADLARLGATKDDTLLWLAIITARPGGVPTVNLRAPLVINPASMRGIQMVAGESTYAFDHPIPAA